MKRKSILSGLVIFILLFVGLTSASYAERLEGCVYEGEYLSEPPSAQGPGGDPLNVQSVTDPLHGSATHDSHMVTYTPDSGFTGSDLFSYTTNDGRGSMALGLDFTDQSTQTNFLYDQTNERIDMSFSLYTLP